MSPLRGFIEECCHLHPDAKAQPKPFFNAYREWHERYQTKPLSQKDFVDHMEALGYYKKKDKGWSWIGISLKEDEDPNPWDWDEDYLEHYRQGRQEIDNCPDIVNIDFITLSTRPPRDLIQNYLNPN